VSRLPPRLQPVWPLVKRGHRFGARVVGAAGRHTVGPRRGLPWTATERSRDTEAAEPDATVVRSVRDSYVVRREHPAGHPSPHRMFTEHREAVVPEQHVLELTDGLLLGRHAAVVTAGGRLDLETSHYFGISGWREHPVFWNPWPRRPEHVDGTVVVLAARATGQNYYHFLMDALPRLRMLEQVHPGLAPDAWVVDRHARYHRELLELVGLGGAPIIEPRPGLSLRAKRLVVPSLPNISTLISPDTTTWLRERLPPRQVAGRPERLYVTRGSTPNTRRVRDEAAILERLTARGFVPIDPGTLSVQDQIDHFAAARVVVGPHGAALANLSFCRPGVRVLELFAPGYVNGGYWSITTNIPDARYRYLIAAGPRHQRPGRAPSYFMDDIDVTPAEVEAALDALLEDA
jgi:capsular polysaccharide biosynthesis protein